MSLKSSAISTNCQTPGSCTGTGTGTRTTQTRNMRTLPRRPGLTHSKTPTLIIAGDADVVTLEHVVSMFRLLGGGIMGDMGVPLPASRLAILPATSHTAVITQVALLHGFIEPFLQGQTPTGIFGQDAAAPQ